MYFKPIKLCVNRGKADKYAVINEQNPILTWGAEHEDNSVCQKAYLIKIYDGEELFWESGRTESENMQAVYCGKEFKANGRYTWELKLEDSNGLESETAYGYFKFAPKTFEKCKWITTKNDTVGAAKYFAKQFEISKEVKRATMYVSAIGCQYVTVNGMEADSAVLSPAVSNFKKQCYCVMLEIEDFLKEGKNSIGIIAGEGWRRNYGRYIEGHNYRKVEFFGVPQLFARVVIEYSDNTSETFDADDTWYGFSGATVFNHLFDGETYDAQKEREGWNMPECDLSGFEHAVYGEEVGRLRVMQLEPIKIQRRYEPVSITMIRPGVYVFDFGVNIAGFAQITVPDKMNAGEEITLYYAEELNGDGSLSRVQQRGAKATDKYISNGKDAKRKWHPQFVYHGFRYIRLEGWHGIPDKKCINALSIYTDVDNDSFFECGSALVNQIHKNIVQTERDNLHGIATDCPQRDERMGWLNDATVRFEETPYNFYMSRMFEKITDDIVCEQVDGAITCTAPFVYGSRPADPVCSSFIVAGMQAYLHYGNAELIKKHYKNFKAWNECLKRRSKDGIVDFSYYGDWAGPEDCCMGSEDPVSAVTPGILMSTGYHYYNYVLLEKMAKILGDEKEREENFLQAQRVKKAFLDKWWDSKTAKVATGSQGCQAFALWLGILRENEQKRAAQVLHETLEKDGWRFTTGNLTTRYLFDVLADYGYTDDAWKLITREEYPSYGYMIQNGATTIWERFELKENDGMNSHNHPMYGAVGEWFYTRLIGVTPLSGGWSKFKVKPCIPEKLIYAQAGIDTVKGCIKVKWVKRYGKVYMNLFVPFGCSAEVEFGSVSKTVGAGFFVFEKDDER